MAVPKHRQSRARQRKRQAASYNVVKACKYVRQLNTERIGKKALPVMPGFSLCPNCGQAKLPHRICGNCGYYGGKEVIKL